MASSRRISSTSLIDRLVQQPQSFDLVQAVRVLQRARRVADDEGDAARTQAQGSRDGTRLEGIRFVSDASVKYPAAPIARAKPGEDGDPTRIAVSLFGLIGPLGVLPYSYTNLAIQSVHEKNPGFGAFLDILQDRAVTFFYGAAVKYRIAYAHETRSPDQPDTFTTVLRSLVGLGTPGLSARLSAPDDVVLHYSGLFSQSTRSLTGLEALLSNELAHPVSVLPFVGGWLPVAPAEQTRTPHPATPEGQYCQLGSSAMLGARAWVAQDYFRIIIGPIDREALQDLLPGGAESNRIVDLTRLYCGLEFDFDINVVIKADSVPAACLAKDEQDESAGRLGQTTWILSAPSPVDRTDAIFPVGRLG